MKYFALLSAVLLAGLAVPAHADDVFTLSTTASGSLGSQTFNDATITISGSYSESSISNFFPTVYSAPTEFTYNIAGIGSVTSTSGGDTFYVFGLFGYAGLFSNYNLGMDQAVVDSTDFASYELTGNLGPVTGVLQQLSGDETSGGLLSLMADSQSAELTVTSGSASVTPEPSSLVLLGTGMCGLAGMVRRRVAKK